MNAREDRTALRLKLYENGYAYGKRPPIARLHELLFYDSGSGKLFWRQQPEDRFSLPRHARSWNAKNAGREAGTLHERGYRHVSIDRKFAYAHRIVWAMVNGAWPVTGLDHIDQDKLNNRIGNLREVPQQINTMNASMHRDNTSGVTGVWQVPSGNWQASVYCRGQKFYLGTFNTLEDAASARKSMQDSLGFSPNHGRART